jgi:hypothetical protein
MIAALLRVLARRRRKQIRAVQSERAKRAYLASRHRQFVNDPLIKAMRG